METKDIKQKGRFSVRKFFFPFSPIKSFRSIRLLFLIAMLLALRIVLAFTAINVGPLGLRISLGWLPILVLGWYFGPVAGLFLGMITDTLTFLATGGGIWFWMYAIQEPIVGLVAGLFGGLARIRKNKETIKITFDAIFSEAIVTLFTVASLTILLKWLSPQDFGHTKPEYVSFYNVFKWVVIGIISLFFVLYEVLFSINLKQNKPNKSNSINWIYTSTVVIVMIMLFSFALGPTIAVEYYKFMNGGLTPESFLKYGAAFYLVPRVAIEGIKVPIEMSVYFGVVVLFDTKVINIVNKINNSWQIK